MRPVPMLPTDNFKALTDDQWRAYTRRASLPSRVGPAHVPCSSLACPGGMYDSHCWGSRFGALHAGMA